MQSKRQNLYYQYPHKDELESTRSIDLQGLTMPTRTLSDTIETTIDGKNETVFNK